MASSRPSVGSRLIFPGTSGLLTFSRAFNNSVPLKGAQGLLSTLLDVVKSFEMLCTLPASSSSQNRVRYRRLWYTPALF